MLFCLNTDSLPHTLKFPQLNLRHIASLNSNNPITISSSDVFIKNHYSTNKKLMFTYFVLLTAIGFVVGFLKKNKQTTLGIIIFIAIAWGLMHQVIWGFVALGELLLGYFLYDIVEGSKDAKKSRDIEND